MPLNYRKNSVTCSTEYYPSVNDLNGPSISQTNRINLQIDGQTTYIGLVDSTHEQASDLSVRIGGQNLRLAKKSKYQTVLTSWGNNEYGQLGINSLTTSLNRCLVCSSNVIFNKIEVSNSSNAVLGLTYSGRLYAWGINGNGQLGNGNTTNLCVPTLLTTCSNLVFCEIGIGNSKSFRITNDGKIYASGFNDGSLGLNCTDFVNYCNPILICCNQLTFCKVKTGTNSAAALTNDGKLYYWGCLQGTGSSCLIPIPTLICSNLTFCKICAGWQHWLGLTNTGALYTWGLNSSGQLGNSSCSNSPFPSLTACSGLIFCEISAGQFFSLAITNTGKLYSWGCNLGGSLGKGASIGDPWFPALTCCNDLNFCKISSGNSHSLAITDDFKLYAWGQNTCGQLGNGNTTDACIPLLICSNLNTNTNEVFAHGFSSLIVQCSWISAGSPLGLSYSSNYVTPLISSSFSTTPTLSNVGIGTLTYSISPSLPAGLNFNTSNGTISGTTPSTTQDNTYTVTVSNPSGSTSVNIRIRIVLLATTMTPGHLATFQNTSNTQTGVYSVGFHTFFYSQLNGRVTNGSMASRAIRGQQVNALNIRYNSDTLNMFLFELAISGSIPNTDEGAYKRVEWNGVTYTRSSMNYYPDNVDDFGTTYTAWAIFVNSPPFPISTFISTGVPSPNTVIIE